VPTLIEAIENKDHPLHYRITPEGKKTEVLARLKAGVNDLSISRAEVTWGIPIPWDPSQTIYVWIEALFNYYTATIITGKKDFWPANLHLLGKEISWFHAAIWEALLIAADLPLPKEIFIHDFYLIDGQKMSKSLGNVIAPGDLINKYGVDGTRYLVASTFPGFSDSSVSWDKFTKKYNADLANGLGNLVARVAKLAENSGFEFKEKPKLEFDRYYIDHLEAYRFNDALAWIWEHINSANQKINETKVWEQDGETLHQNLQSLIVVINQIAYHLKPFMPKTAEKILAQFSKSKITASEPLFPRLK
jgi:methionyl-tRNA synthetase